MYEKKRRETEKRIETSLLQLMKEQTLIKDNSIYAFVESDTINPCRLSQFKYYWYLELTQDGNAFISFG